MPFSILAYMLGNAIRVFVLLMLFPVVQLHAQKVYEFDATCQSAYRELTSLKIDSGLRLIQQARQQNPDNLIPALLESYADFFILFFNEDPSEYSWRKNSFEKHLDELEKGSKSSPFYNYSRAVVNLHRAIVAVKFGERLGAAWDFRRAFNLIKANERKYPQFTPNKLLAGPLQVGVGTIPPGYRWLANLFGMSGSIKQGMQNLRSFLNSNDPYSRIFFNEASFYYCYLSFYFENNQEEVYNYIVKHKLDIVNNHVFAYMATNLAKNNKNPEYAIKAAVGRNMSAAYLKTPVWDLELGYLYLHRLETGKSINHFERFTSAFRGNTYLKEAYHKLSWAYYLEGKMQEAEAARQKAISRGTTSTDADKRSHKEAKAGKWPNVLLLKARLLNDGGMNTEALKLLAGKDQGDFKSFEEKLEFVYRAARIYDDMGRLDDALKFYNITIQQGSNRTEYFAARAALQAGMIMEKKGNKTEARKYYQQCLDMEGHDFEDSIDQRAKAGLLRCEGA